MTDDSRRSAALLAVATLTVMSTLIVAPAIPDMAAAFRDAPHAELYTKLILTIPAMAIVVCAPLAGWVIDRFGRLRILYGAMLLYGAAGMAGAVLDDLGQILVSRALLGVAIAGTMTTMTTLAGDYFRGEARARFSSMQSVVMSLGAVFAVALAGIVAETNWRYAFLLYGTGWILLAVIWRWLDEPARAASLDGESLPNAHGSDVPVVMTAALRRELAVLYGVTLFAVAMFYVIHVQAPFVARAAGTTSASMIGFALAMSSFAAAVSSAAYTAIKRRASFAQIYALSFALMAIGYALITAFPSFPMLFVGSALAGLGVGLFFPNGSVWAVTIAPPTLRGRVSGGLTASVFLGQFLSPIVLQPVVSKFGAIGSFGAGAILLALGAAVFTVVPAVMRARPA